MFVSPAFAQQSDPEELRVKDVIALADDWQVGLLAVASVIVLLILWLGDIIRPGSLSKAGLRQVDPYLSAVWLFAALLVYLSTSFAAGFVVQQDWISGGEEGSLRHEGALALTTYAITAGIAIGMCYLISRSAPNAGLKVRWIDVSLGLLAFALALPLVLLAGVLSKAVYLQMKGAEPDPIAHPTLELISQNYPDQWAMVIIFCVVVLVPIIEEICRRCAAGLRPRARARRCPWRRRSARSARARPRRWGRDRTRRRHSRRGQRPGRGGSAFALPEPTRGRARNVPGGARTAIAATLSEPLY